ncbi:nicotinate-nucleotide--dimethylbenzimidazole phosphoribosyltransferase [Anaerolentibacter hominis]|uniref:nicotinate-nucleotide--dimethylbenzimidazole phosphoribosyltransferase n=1 Tax=Anaerolentibacter hominis TaxID=3079009 RepID=UPI0031B89716
MQKELERQLCRIERPSEAVRRKAQEKWDASFKPIGALGKLEELIVKIAGILGTTDVNIGNRAIIVMCGDNGVVSNGVTQTGQGVTAVVTNNMGERRASISRIAAVSGAEVIPVNIGVAGEIVSPGVLDRRIARGTEDISRGPAMTQEEVYRAIQTGIDLVRDCREKGVTLLGTGEMGIGNTTTSSAILSVLLSLAPEQVTGRGAGLDSKGLKRKLAVIAKAIEINHPLREQPFAVLRTLGGLDIAGLTGVFLGGGIYHVPIVIDGLISGTAALLAERMKPGIKEFMIPSHLGKEPASRAVLDELGLEPVIQADLALGEGSGAAMLFPLLDMALSIYTMNTTFEEFHIPAYVKFET